MNEQAHLAAILYNNIGLTLGSSALQTSIAMLRRAVALDPSDSNPRQNLAAFLLNVGEDDEAFDLLSVVAEEQPHSHLPHGMLGAIATRRGDLNGAICHYKRAVELAPGDAQAGFNLSAAYLRNGDFSNGWPYYESRRTLPGTLVFKAPDAPEWPGPKYGKRAKHLYIYGEQGLGDKIQFARFIPWAKCWADKITFALDPASTTLLWGYTRDCDIVIGGSPVEGVDYQVPLGRLPGLYGVTADNIPPDPRYLRPADVAHEICTPGQLKIGMVWAGNPMHPNDDIRSLKFEDIIPLLIDPRNAYFSLQVGPRAADIAQAQAQRLITDLSGNIQGDWSHTAAAIQQMDLIVCADTGVAHLAGALGKAVFVMIQRFSDWRWMWDRSDTPWYPTMRLFRQEKIFDWRPVVCDVGEAIADIHRRAAVRAVLSPQSHNNDQDYEPDVTEVMHRALRPGDVFFDVGANIGRHTVEAARLVGPEGQVVAFEPGSNNLPILCAATKDLPQVQIVARPVWNEIGNITFYLNADDGGGNSIWDPAVWPGPQNPKSKETPQPVILHATTLDNEIMFGAKVPRLIKIDTEGAEQRVLEGALGLILDHKPPFILAELHEFGLAQFGCSQQSLRQLMEGAGYSTFTLFTDGGMPQLVPPESRIETGYIINLLFSTPQAVSECWPTVPIVFPRLRPMLAYGMPPDDKASAA